MTHKDQINHCYEHQEVRELCDKAIKTADNRYLIVDTLAMNNRNRRVKKAKELRTSPVGLKHLLDTGTLTLGIVRTNILRFLQFNDLEI